jgi:hypothetical protein
MTIRQIVIKRMHALDANPNRLARAVAPHVGRSQVFEYLADRRDISSESLTYILKALGLSVMVAPEHQGKKMDEHFKQKLGEA